MRKQLAVNILAATAVTAALCLTGPAAVASGTWTVTGGEDFTAAQSSGTTITFTDTTKNQTISCTVATAKGTVTDQSHSTNTDMGTITESTFGGSGITCKGPFAITITITQKAGTSMMVHTGSYIEPVTTGTLTGVDWVLSVTRTFSCSAEIQGTAGFTYNNSTHSFTLTTAGDDLKITSSSCPSIIFQANDRITVSSSGSLTATGSPNNPIQVSQP